MVAVTIEIPGPNPGVVLTFRNTRDVRQTVSVGDGIVTLILPKNVENVIYEPQERTVLVSSGAGGDDTYFKQLSLPRGQLRPSCCAADAHVTISCPGMTTQTISLLSPCDWSTNQRNGVVRSIGNVFAKSDDLTLPVSISGVRYPPPSGKIDLRPTGNPCDRCSRCENDANGQCYCYTHTPQNTLEFLQARALGFTYITEIQKLFPSWLNISVDLDLTLDTSLFTRYDLLAPITRTTEEVSSVEGCEHLSGLMGSIFSVLRYDKTLSADIDDEIYTYSEIPGNVGSENTMCFAVDMCKGLDSPVHMQISQPINDILASRFLRHFTSRQWTTVFNTISVFKNAEPHRGSRQFWNGVKNIAAPEILPDVSTNVNVGLNFSDGDLDVRFEFAGISALKYEVCV